MALEVGMQGRVLLRLPQRASDQEAWLFYKRHEAWLKKRLESLAQRPVPRELNPDEIAALKRRAKEVLPLKLAYWAERLQVKPAGLRITSAATRFGSCSARGRICFSWRLMRYPEDAIDYVVLHEAAHLKHLNHSQAFYQCIALHMPDYKRRRALLKQGPID